MDWWFLVYAAGSLQAGLLTLTLWQRRRSSRATQLLTGWMALLCFDLGMHAWELGQPGAIAFKPRRLVGLLPYLHGSLFYLYVRAVIHAPPWRLADLRHGLGFALALLASLDLLLLDTPDARLAAAASHRAGVFGRAFYLDIFLFVYSLSYIGAALLAIRRHRHRLRATRSDSHPDALRWLVVMALCQCLIWGIASGAWLLPDEWISYRMIYVAVAGWVLLVGYFSLLQAADLPNLAGSGDSQKVDPASNTQPPDVDPPPAVTPLGESSRETGTDAEDPRSDEVAARLQQLMSDQALHREPALTIARLARRSGYPEYLVSAVINRRFGVPFWDYINRLRVEAVRECLLDSTDTRTALEIAYACGFSSKSTFNVAFKRFAGETPSAYRARAERTPTAGPGATDTIR